MSHQILFEDEKVILIGSLEELGQILVTNREVMGKLDQILTREKMIMATLAEFQAGFQRMDQATSQIAARLKRLSDQISAGGMTPDEEAQAVAQLNAAASALEAMGKEPENPVPVEPEVPGEPVVEPNPPV
jgi:hypothetical protein